MKHFVLLKESIVIFKFFSINLSIVSNLKQIFKINFEMNLWFVKLSRYIDKNINIAYSSLLAKLWAHPT